MGKLSSFLLFLTFLVCIAKDCYCQKAISISEINNQSKINISDHVEIYAADKKAHFKDVKNLPLQYWKQNHNPNTINLKISDSIYWFRFCIINNGNANKYFLKITNKGINHLDLFSLIKDSIKHYGKTGDYYPFGQRPFHSNHFIYPIELHQGDSVIFYLACDKKNENLNTALFIYTEYEIIKEVNKTSIYMGVILGILLLAFIINIFLVYSFVTGFLCLIFAKRFFYKLTVKQILAFFI